MDKHIRLIDSPGVVFSSIHEETESTDPMAAGGNLLRNCVSIDEISNYLPVVEALLHRVTGPYLMQLYNIPRFPEHDATAFLSAVARVQGKLKKGGIPLLDAAAKTVLHDWNVGKIRYFTQPPELPAEEVAAEAEMVDVRKTDTQLLSTLSAGINWDTWGKSTEAVSSLPAAGGGDAATTEIKKKKKSTSGGSSKQKGVAFAAMDTD